MAPEVITHGTAPEPQYTKSADIFSLGAVIFELCTLMPYVKASSLAEIRRQVKPRRRWRCTRTPPLLVTRVLSEERRVELRRHVGRLSPFSNSAPTTPDAVPFR